MQSEQRMTIETLLPNVIFQANRVGEAVEKPKWFRVNCREMEKQVSQLQQILRGLLHCWETLGSIHPVISEVSRILQEALNITSKCKRETFFCGLFNGAQTTNDFHKLFRLLDFCIAYMNWLLIIYNPDFNSAFNEIFLSLPQILSNDSSIPSAWCCMLLIMLNSDDLGIVEVEGLLLCLAKRVGAEHGESQCNYLMCIMEIAAAAESNLDIRCKAFKTNSPGAKAIVEELLRVIKQSEDPRVFFFMNF